MNHLALAAALRCAISPRDAIRQDHLPVGCPKPLSRALGALSSPTAYQVETTSIIIAATDDGALNRMRSRAAVIADGFRKGECRHGELRRLVTDVAAHVAAFEKLPPRISKAEHRHEVRTDGRTVVTRARYGDVAMRILDDGKTLLTYLPAERTVEIGTSGGRAHHGPAEILAPLHGVTRTDRTWRRHRVSLHGRPAGDARAYRLSRPGNAGPRYIVHLDGDRIRACSSSQDDNGDCATLEWHTDGEIAQVRRVHRLQIARHRWQVTQHVLRRREAPKPGSLRLPVPRDAVVVDTRVNPAVRHRPPHWPVAIRRLLEPSKR